MLSFQVQKVIQTTTFQKGFTIFPWSCDQMFVLSQIGPILQSKIWQQFISAFHFVPLLHCPIEAINALLSLTSSFSVRRRHERQQRSKLVSKFRVDGDQSDAGGTSDVVSAMHQFWERIGTNQTYIPSNCPGDEKASEVFQAVQRHYQCRKEEVTVVSKAKLVLGPTNGRLQKFAPIDCLAISRTHQVITAIVIVDDDPVEEPETTLKRVNATQTLLEEFFGGEFREGWSFVGLVFASGGTAQGVCEECRDFVILGPEEMWEKLRRVLERVKRERPRFSPSPAVYHTIAASLAFLASSSVQTIENGTATWTCWSPSQLALLQYGTTSRHVVLYGDQRVGKTETMVTRAIAEVKEGKKVLFVICSTKEGENNTDRLYKAGATVESMDCKAFSAINLVAQVALQLKEQSYHSLFIDSLPIPNSETELLTKEISLLSQKIDGLLWIAASPEVSLDPDITLLGQSSLCSFLQDSFMQVDDGEEETKIKVVVPEVILKVFPVPWFIHKLDGPQFLSTS